MKIIGQVQALFYKAYTYIASVIQSRTSAVAKRSLPGSPITGNTLQAAVSAELAQVAPALAAARTYLSALRRFFFGPNTRPLKALSTLLQTAAESLPAAPRKYTADPGEDFLAYFEEVKSYPSRAEQFYREIQAKGLGDVAAQLTRMRPELEAANELFPGLLLLDHARTITFRVKQARAALEELQPPTPLSCIQELGDSVAPYTVQQMLQRFAQQKVAALGNPKEVDKVKNETNTLILYYLRRFGSGAQKNAEQLISLEYKENNPLIISWLTSLKKEHKADTVLKWYKLIYN